ncbi:hypothetical protein FDZ73_22320 [bacterium]|nr:MAG: hypothetical protein FDZ73_22320 [bacterium]
MQLMSLGATFVFFVFVLWFVAKYGPKYVDAKKLEAEADKELALALAGLQGEIRYSRETCSKAQDGMVVCTQETEDRLGKQVEDLKRVAVNALKHIEEVNTVQKEHVKKTEQLQQAVGEVLHGVTELKAWHQAPQKS